MNNSAPSSFAIAALSDNSNFLFNARSSSLVIITFIPYDSNLRFTAFAISRFNFFSINPFPEVPESFPPCPGSKTIVNSSDLLNFKGYDSLISFNLS